MRKIIVTAAVFAFFIAAAWAFASAPVELPAKPDSGMLQQAKKKKDGPSCTVRGRLFCSEYGSRYKEPVAIVFNDGDDSYSTPAGEIDGSFAVSLPCGAVYTMRIEFQGKGFDTGQLAVPDKVEGGIFNKFIEIYHPGSLLELIWEIRDGGGVNTVDVKLKDIPKEPGKPEEPAAQ